MIGFRKAVHSAKFQTRHGWRLRVLLPTFILILSVCSLTGDALSEDEYPIDFDYLTVADGLVHNAILSLYQDSRGFLWAGTEFGLNCYDGFKFQQYTPDPSDAHAISHSFVFDMVEDNLGIIWFGSQYGLNRFDPCNQRFTLIPLDAQHKLDLFRNWAHRLILDREGMIWIGTQGNGLFRFNPENSRFIDHYTHDPNISGSISHNYIETLHLDRDGILWIGTRNGINRFNRLEDGFDHYIPEGASRKEKVFTTIYTDKRGGFWAGSLDGLFLFNPRIGRFTRPFEKSNVSPWLNSGPIYKLIGDSKGSLWVGTRTGLTRMNLDLNRSTRYQYQPGVYGGISENHIMDLLMDSNGILWVGTYGGGLNKIVFRTKPFGLYQFDPDNPHGLSYRSVLGVIEDREGIVWMGTRGGGLNRLDRITGQFKHYKADINDLRCLTNDDIPIIIESSVDPDKLWLGTLKGLNCFDKKTEIFTRYLHESQDHDIDSNNQIYALLEDRKGTLWVGTWGGGLRRFHRNSGAFTCYLNSRKNPSSINNNMIWDIFEDRKFRLWIGTGGGGLNLMNPDTGAFRSYQNQSGNPSSLSNNNIIAIHEDSRGFLWLGTLGGVNRFNPATGNCLRYSVKDGLPDNVVYGILEDNQGYFWFSTNKGLSRFNPRNGHFRNYAPQDGLQDYEFNMHSYWKNDRGEFYFGGINGLNVFDPSKITENPRIPPVVLTVFKIFNRPVPIKPEGGSPLKSTIMYTRCLTLPHHQHSISFEFSALDFTFPERNQYAYRLVGLDEDWVYLGNKHDITFAHLSPGQYRLRIKASNSDGIWNEQGTGIDIIILPPFWETWWFRIIMVLLAVVLVSILHFVRMKRITEKLKSEAAMERFFNRNGISSREREIILLILQGKSNKRIEEELFISLGTVKNHVFNIFRKLQINSRVQLVNLFRRLPRH